MYLVNEKHVAFFKIGEQGRKVGSLFDCRAARHSDLRAELACNDVRKRGFAKPGRAVQQNVIERVVSRLCGRDEHFKILLDLLLPHVLVHIVRTKAVFLLVFIDGERAHHPVCDVKVLIFFCEL